MKATPDSSDSLVFECDFEEPPEKVWRALTEPRLLEAWLTTGDSPRTGSRRETAAPGLPPPAREPAESSDRGTRRVGHVGSSDYEVVTAEPNRLVRYRWRERASAAGESAEREVHSVVTVELAPCPTGGTHLRLTHGEFRIVAVAPPITTARVSSITSARRPRTPKPSLAVHTSLRWAA
jgi:uncharacterized protein YndB with AHSA1/START domain